jgi:hypothetical protein
MKKFQSVLVGLLFAINMYPAMAEDIPIEVYKSPTCGCCEGWISHLEQNGFKVSAHNRDDMQAIKAQYHIAPQMQSCHTGIVEGYFIEGHVPARDIKKLLSERPDIHGLSVPGMPAGTNVPGMETRPGTATFDVMAVGEGEADVYTHYE